MMKKKKSCKNIQLYKETIEIFASDLESFQIVVKEHDDENEILGMNNELWLKCSESLKVVLRLPFAHFISIMCFDTENLQRFFKIFLRKRKRSWEEPEYDAAHIGLEDQVFACFHRLAFHGSLQDIESVVTGGTVLDLAALYGARYGSECTRILVKALESMSVRDETCVLLKNALTALPAVVEYLKSGKKRDVTIDFLVDLACTVGTFLKSVGKQEAAGFLDPLVCVKKQNLGAMDEFVDADLLALWKVYEEIVCLLGKKQSNSSLATRRGLLWWIDTIMYTKYWYPYQESSRGTQVDPAQLLDILFCTIEYAIQNDSGGAICVGDLNAELDLGTRLKSLAESEGSFADRANYLFQVLESVQTSTWETEKHQKLNLKGVETGVNSRKKHRDFVKEERRKKLQMDESIKQVRQVLPNLSTYFCKQLLIALSGDVSKAIQAVLEGALPSMVAHLDPHEPELVAVDKGPDNIADLLDELAIGGASDDEIDDDDEMAMLRSKILGLAAAQNEYEDEYDDAYDDAGFNVGDEFAAKDDGPSWKPGMLDVDGKKRDRDGKEIVEKEDDYLMKPNLNRTRPAPVGTKRKNKNHPNPTAPAPPTTGSSATATSGDPATARSRKYAQKNKAKIANHSRKKGAAKKQARAGM